MAARTKTRAPTAFAKVKELSLFAEVDREEIQKAIRQQHDRGNIRPEQLRPCETRIKAVYHQLCEEFVGRENAARLMIACTMAGVPLVLFGPPGTAKTLMVRRMAALCGLELAGGTPGEDEDTPPSGGCFDYLLTQHTMPEEVFGPPSITALEDGKFLRVTAGFLPEAELGFLDEIFRGGSHILNALLTIINERKFHNGQRLIDVPLLNVIGAANEPPEDPQVEAFYDRFPIRVWVDSIFANETDDERATTQAQALFGKSRGHARKQGSGATPTEPLACLNDFWALRARLVNEAWSPANDEAGEAFTHMFLRCRDRCGLSDRSLFSLALVARALGVLAGQPSSSETFRYLFPYTAPDKRLFEEVRAELGMDLSGEAHGGAE